MAPKAKRTGIYVGPPLAKMLENRPDGETFSGRVNQMALRYGEIVRRELPELTEPEWNVLRDVLNGYWMMDELSIATVPMEVADGIRLNGVDEKHGLEDGLAFVARLRDLPFSQLVAIVEAVERWWGDPEAGTAPPESG